MLRRRVAGGVGALLRLLFGGVVDCRVRVRVQVVVLLCWGSAEGWSHEAWAGRYDRGGQRKVHARGPFQRRSASRNPGRVGWGSERGA